MYIELCSQIARRISFDDPTLVAVKGINPLELSDSLIPLINLFPSLIEKNNIDELESQWHESLNQEEVPKNLRLDEYWNKIFNLKNAVGDPMFPLLIKFIGPILALPHSSATVERVFSQLNLIKSKQRNALHTATVNAIMIGKGLLDDIDAVQWNPSEQILSKYKIYSQ